MKNYKQKRNKGLIKIVKINDLYVFSIKKFDSEYGTEVESEIKYVESETIIKNIERLQKEIDNCKEILNDLKHISLIDSAKISTQRYFEKCHQNLNTN